MVPLGLQRASDHGTNGPQNVVPSVALVPQAWSYARAPFHTGKRGVGAPMELPFILGAVLPVALVPSSRWYHRRARRPRRPGVRPAPRAATGPRVGARRPGSWPITGGGEGRVADARETTKPPGSPAPAILRGGGAVWRPLGSQPSARAGRTTVTVQGKGSGSVPATAHDAATAAPPIAKEEYPDTIRR